MLVDRPGLLVFWYPRWSAIGLPDSTRTAQELAEDESMMVPGLWGGHIYLSGQVLVLFHDSLRHTHDRWWAQHRTHSKWELSSGTEGETHCGDSWPMVDQEDSLGQTSSSIVLGLECALTVLLRNWWQHQFPAFKSNKKPLVTQAPLLLNPPAQQFPYKAYKLALLRVTGDINLGRAPSHQD